MKRSAQQANNATPSSSTSSSARSGDVGDNQRLHLTKRQYIDAHLRQTLQSSIEAERPSTSASGTVMPKREQLMRGTVDRYEPQLTTTTNGPYNPTQCVEMMLKVHDFVEKFTCSNDNSGLIIVENVTKTLYSIPNTSSLKFADFATYFEVTGHSLSTSYHDNYVVKLAIDMDCIKCRNGDCSEGPMITTSYLAILGQNVKEIVTKVLNARKSNTVNPLMMDYVIFKRQNSCNLHIYFNISVSIALLSTLVAELRANVSPIVMEKYKIDDVSTLGLPYSAKKDGEVYLQAYPVCQTVYNTWRILPDMSCFYDLEMFLVREINFSQETPIGEVTYSNQNKIDRFDFDDFEEDTVLTNHLVTPINASVTVNSQIKALIIQLKNGSSSFTSVFNGNLEKYLNINTFNCEQYNINMSKFQEMLKSMPNGDAELMTKIHKEVENLASKFIILNNARCTFTNLLTYFVTKDCSYAFYMFCGIAKYVAERLAKTEGQETRITKSVFIYFRKMLANVSKFRESDYLCTILETCCRFNFMPKMGEYMGKSSKWLTAICNEILKVHNPDLMVFFYMEAYELSTVEDLKDFMVKYLKRMQVAFKNPNSVFVYDSRNGLYEDYAANISKYMTVPKFIHLQHFLKKSLLALQENGVMKDEKIKELVPQIMLTYYETLDKPVETFNMYYYFIATKRGIFNTITGTYMSFVPTLYFKTQKDYCTVLDAPIDQNYLAIESNMNLLEKYITVSDITSTVIQKQNDLFYLTIMVPGLMILKSSLFVPDLVKSIFLGFGNRFADDSTCVKKLYYLQPVILHYQLDLDIVMQYSMFYYDLMTSIDFDYEKLINAFYNAKNEDPSNQFSIHRYKVVKRREFDYSRKYNNFTDIVDELFAVYHNFETVTFALTYIALLFDYYVDQRLKLFKNLPKAGEYPGNISLNDDTDDEESEFESDNEDMEEDVVEVPQRAQTPINVDDSADGEQLLNPSGSKRLLYDHPPSSVDTTTYFPINFVSDNVYRVGKLKNYERAFKILFNKNIDTSSPLLIVLYTYSNVFKFNTLTLDEFLYSFAMLYFPASPRKKLLVLIGPPKCGKTQFVKMLEKMHKSSTFSTTGSLLAENNSGPAQDHLKLMGSYLVNISEVRKINVTSLKSITGDDGVTKRGMYSKDHTQCSPLPFLVGSTNDIPTMPFADEAIRVRLSFFTFDYKFVDYLDLLSTSQIDAETTDEDLKRQNECKLQSSFIDDNPLKMYENKLTYMPNTKESYSHALANILYTQYQKKRSYEAIVTWADSLTNVNSVQTLDNFLCKNNLIYRILNKLNIKFKSGLRLDINLLKPKVEPYLPEKVNIDTFMENFEMLFTAYKNPNDPNIYQNMGFLRESNQSDPVIFKKCKKNKKTGKESKVSVMDAIRHLISYKYTEDEAREIVVRLSHEMPASFDKITSMFVGVKLVKLEN